MIGIAQSRHDVFLSFHGSQRLYSDEDQEWTMRNCVVEKLASSELQRQWVAHREETQNLGKLSIFYDKNDTRERLDEIWEGLLKTRGGGIVAILVSEDYFNQTWCLAELLAAKRLCACPDEKERIRLCFIAVGMTVGQLKENWFMKTHALDLLTGNNAASICEIAIPEASGRIDPAINDLVSSIAKAIVKVGSCSLAVGKGQEDSFIAMVKIVHRTFERSIEYNSLLLDFRIQDPKNALLVMGRLQDIDVTPQRLKSFLDSTGPSSAKVVSEGVLCGYERKWLSDWSDRDWALCKNDLAGCLDQAKSLLQSNPELSSKRPRTYSEATVAVTASDSSDCSSTQSDGSEGFVGVDFTRRPMNKDKSWNVNVKESEKWLENLLRQLIEFGSDHSGMPSLSVKRNGGIFNTRIVVMLSCKIRLRDDLEDFELDEVRAICKSLKLNLVHCGATPEEVDDYMIGTIWKKCLCMILEIPNRIVDGLYAKVVDANWNLDIGYEGITITGLSPAFKITMPVVVKVAPPKGTQVPDVWLLEQDGAQILLPRTDAARSSMMRGGMRLSEFLSKDTLQRALRSLPKIRATGIDTLISWHSNQRAVEQLPQYQQADRQPMEQRGGIPTLAAQQQHQQEGKVIEAKKNHDGDLKDIREQLQLVIEKKRCNPVEVSAQYIREIDTDESLGKGFFGVVSKGYDKVLGVAFVLNKVNMQVFESASPTRIEGISNSFQNEMNILGKLDHPNIATLYGFYFDPNDISKMCLIYELASNGSLDRFWKDDHQRQRLSTGCTRVRIAYEVAMVLRYMHEGLDWGGVCFHQDIKSANVFLNADFTVRVIDCGLSKFVEESEDSFSSAVGIGTKGYICPNYNDGEIEYESSCDVFSFGVFLCELLTGKTNPSGKHGHYIAFEKKKTKVLIDHVDMNVEWDACTCESLVELALECIKSDSELRPTIRNVFESLHKILYFDNCAKMSTQASNSEDKTNSEVALTPGDSDSTASIAEGSFGQFNGVMGKHSITVLHSAPLVFKDAENNLHPLENIDFEKERDEFLRCFKETSRDIDLLFDNATPNALLKAMDRKSSCVHFSGHCYGKHLAFEDGKGGLKWLGAEELRDLIKVTKGEPFKLAFVLASMSEQIGNSFVDAGVPHVVCCRQDSEVKESAALEFTYHFYFSLTLGHTVQDSFEQGCKAAPTERGKFVLLPKRANHDISLFADAKAIRKWPPKSSRHTVSKSSSWSPPMPPQHFLGREINMYHLLNMILSNRLVSVTGEDGIGKSSLVRGVCQYISERKRCIIEIDCIMYVKIKRDSSISTLLQDLLTVKCRTPTDAIDWESVRRAICNTTQFNRSMLLVVDRIDCLAESNNQKGDLIKFLSVLFEEPKAKRVKVVLAGRMQLGVTSITGVPERHYQVEPLNFESTVKLFCCFCGLVQTSADRNRLKTQLLATQENDIERVYRTLGNGIPLEIEKIACSMSHDELNTLISANPNTPGIV